MEETSQNEDGTTTGVSASIWAHTFGLKHNKMQKHRSTCTYKLYNP